MRFRITTRVKLHVKPSTSAAVVGEIPANTVVELLERQHAWIYLAVPEKQQGWVREDLLPRWTSIVRSVRRKRTNLVASDRLTRVSSILQKALIGRPVSNVLAPRLSLAMARVRELNRLALAAQSFMQQTSSGEPEFSRRLTSMSGQHARTPPNEFVGLNGAEIPGDIDFPRRPRLVIPGRDCFVNPFVYGALFGALARWTERFFSKEDLRERQWHYVSAVFPALRDLQILESLDAVLSDAFRIGNVKFDLGPLADAAERLLVNNDGSDDGIKAISLAFDTTLPIPGFPFPGFTIDPCVAERWGETARALACVCTAEYDIRQLVNVSRTYPDGTARVGEACPGEWLRIEGSGYGASREWTGGLGASEVRFAGAGIGAGSDIAAAEYRLWSDTAIEARVPEAVVDGYVSILVLCEETTGDCSSAVFKFPSLGSERHLAVPPPPRLVELSYSEREVYAPREGPLVAPPYEIRAVRCGLIRLRIVADGVEAVTLADESGALVDIPGAEGGLRRRIDATVDLRSSVTRTYSLTLFGGCGSAPVISISVPRQIWLEFDAVGSMHAGERLTNKVRLKCPPAQFGLERVRVDLSSSDPAVVALNPLSLEFAAHEVSKDVELVSGSVCSMCELTARISGETMPSGVTLAEFEYLLQRHVAVVPSFFIFEAHASGGFGMCGDNRVRVTASCCPGGRLPAAVSEVHAVSPAGTEETGWVVDVVEPRPGNTASVEFARTGSAPLVEGPYRFWLVLKRWSDGELVVFLESNQVSLTTSRRPTMSLGSFTADPPETESRIEGLVRGEALFAQSLHLYSMRLSGFPATWGLDREIAAARTADPCNRLLTVTARERYVFGDRFTLLAVGFSGERLQSELRIGRPETASDEPVEEEPPPPVGWRSMRIVNYATFKVNVYVAKSDGPTTEALELVATLNELPIDRRVPAPAPEEHTVAFDDGWWYAIAIYRITVSADVDPGLVRCRGTPKDGAGCLQGITAETGSLLPMLGDADGIADTYNIGSGPGVP